MYDKDGNGYSKITGVAHDIQSLHEEMEPWWVRHLKRERCCDHHPNGVMPWLPPKYYSRVWVDLSPTQRKIYDQMRKDMIAWIGEHEDTPFMAQLAVVQLARLSQIAIATPDLVWKTIKVFDKSEGRYIDEAKMIVNLKAPSSKIDAVKELLKDNSNKSFVIFSSSKKGCYLAQQELANAGISGAVFSGDQNDVQRERIKRDFIGGNLQAFIGVIRACGEGVDGLQRVTDTGIFIDRDWSSFRNKQAEDRLDRDGKSEATQIIDIMARGTLDFGKHQRLEAKWSWIKKMLGDIPQAQAAMLEGKDLLEGNAA
jgi:SNF2 family DNA or RNA helicase